MSSPRVLLSLPKVDFGQVRQQVRAFVWRPQVHVVEVGSPTKIAPYALAIEAELDPDGDREAASGRLIVLHDPAGNDAWEGEFRCVSLAQADVDLAMATDPCLNEVGWSWLTDALNRAGCDYVAESGTVTTITGRGFGGLAAQPARAEIEIRSSWTPVFTGAPDIRPHLEAWQHLLCLVAGVAPLPDEVAELRRRLDDGRPS